MKFSSAVGIAFDAQTAHFVGTPTVAGDYQIHFLYRDQNQWRSGQCTFIINADPRSLWQVNEPSADEPYHKAHTAQHMICNDDFKLIAASRRGRSHEHAGTFRDDDFFIGQVTDSPWSVLVVADGAGSAQFSRQGSKIAADCVGQLLIDYIQQNQNTIDENLAQWQTASGDDNSKTTTQSALYKDFHDIFYKVVQISIQRIETEAQAQNVPAKAFATTLLAAVVKQQDQQTFISTIWIGDGAIVVYSADQLSLMGTPDSGEFAGQTRFLDQSILSNFSERVNMGYFDDIAAVILMTDGISDPKFETDAGLKNQQKWDALWQELQNPLAEEQPDSALLEWMHFFSSGHHDDRTLALFVPQAPDLTSTQGLNHE
ncbi:MAG: protein phosphatase 2C domain-containing protein [Candidatus Saccharibacteria bacterium]|nr:protein phosphatase 2C domain-containing protein [Moraxellaceae bacterium]